MPLLGKYHWETLLATGESLRISLMWWWVGGLGGGAGEDLCRMSDTFSSPCCSVSLPLGVCGPPPHPPHPPQPVVNYTQSRIAGSLLGK